MSRCVTTCSACADMIVDKVGQDEGFGRSITRLPIFSFIYCQMLGITTSKQNRTKWIIQKQKNMITRPKACFSLTWLEWFFQNEVQSILRPKFTSSWEALHGPARRQPLGYGGHKGHFSSKSHYLWVQKPKVIPMFDHSHRIRMYGRLMLTFEVYWW